MQRVKERVNAALEEATQVMADEARQSVSLEETQATAQEVL